MSEQEKINNIFLSFDTTSPGSVDDLRRKLEANSPQSTKEQIDAAQQAITQIARLAQRRAIEPEKCKITKNESTYTQMQEVIRSKVIVPPQVSTLEQEHILKIFLKKLSQLTFVDEEHSEGGGANVITLYLHYFGWHPETEGPRLLQLNYCRDDTFTLTKYKEGRQDTLCRTGGMGIPSIAVFEPFLVGEKMLAIDLVRDSEIVMDMEF